MHEPCIVCISTGTGVSLLIFQIGNTVEEKKNLSVIKARHQTAYELPNCGQARYTAAESLPRLFPNQEVMFAFQKRGF